MPAKPTASCPDRVTLIGRELAKVIAQYDAADDEGLACRSRNDAGAARAADHRKDRASKRITDLEDAILVLEATSLEGALRQLLVAKSVANAVMEDAPDQALNQHRVVVALRSVIEVLRRAAGYPDRDDIAGEHYAPEYTNPFVLAASRSRAA